MHWVLVEMLINNKQEEITLNSIYIFLFMFKIMNKRSIDKLKYLGLSIGIFGCLFKIMSWYGASILLIIGLSLLGLYFLIKVFQK